jgi:nucleoside-diphosphate-sugar epimerase
MTVLVTGCAGFVGSHLTESLLSDGYTVIGVDCFNDNYARPAKLRNLELAREWREFDFVPIDLARGELRDIVAECETVFHLAAEPGVRASWGNRFDGYLRNNVLATQHLLEATQEQPGRRFVFASSSSVYGQGAEIPTSETALPRPFSPYGTTKLAAEHLCRAYHDNFGVETVILRYFTVYGPRQRPDMAFSKFCNAALNSEPVVIFGDGRQTRDFTFVSDIVAATRAAAVRPGVAGSTYNIGGGARTSVREILEIVQQCAGRPLDVRNEPVRHGDVHDTVADTTLAKRDLAYSPTTTVAEGVRTQYDWAAAASALTPQCP